LTDRDALLRAIIAHPGDDTPRLVYADWCEENGEEARARFIREQVGHPDRKCTFWEWLGDFHSSCNGRDWVWRRGFIEGVILSAEDWALRCTQLIERYPIRSVELTTRPDLTWHGESARYVNYCGGVTEKHVLDQRIKDGEKPRYGASRPPEGVARFGSGVWTAHTAAHILRALWPSIPLAGWKLPGIGPDTYSDGSPLHSFDAFGRTPQNTGRPRHG
jgi:uncharacterized protein (TIGR02996 family)